MGVSRLTIRDARPADYEAVGVFAVAAYRSLGAVPEPYEHELLDVAARAAMPANQPIRVDERSWRVIELVLGFVALFAAFALNGR